MDPDIAKGQAWATIDRIEFELIDQSRHPRTTRALLRGALRCPHSVECVAATPPASVPELRWLRWPNIGVG